MAFTIPVLAAAIAWGGGGGKASVLLKVQSPQKILLILSLLTVATLYLTTLAACYPSFKLKKNNLDSYKPIRHNKNTAVKKSAITLFACIGNGFTLHSLIINNGSLLSLSFIIFFSRSGRYNLCLYLLSGDRTRRKFSRKHGLLS